MTGRETTETTLENATARVLLAGNPGYWRGDSMCSKDEVRTDTQDRRQGDKTPREITECIGLETVHRRRQDCNVSSLHSESTE